MRLLRLIAVILATVNIASITHADLLFPMLGTKLAGSNLELDDAIFSNRDLGFFGEFFGSTFTTVDISTNGNLNFNFDADYANVAIPDSSGIARISPLWDDFIIRVGRNSAIYERQILGSCYTVTWQNMEPVPGSGQRNTFQASWFGDLVTWRGFDFFPGDIVLSYGAVNAPFSEEYGFPGATVGLDSGDGTNFAALPGSSDGLLLDSDKSLFLTAFGSFTLFRPDGLGGYTVTNESAGAVAPESGGWVLMLAGLSPFAIRVAVRKRQIRLEAKVGMVAVMGSIAMLASAVPSGAQSPVEKSEPAIKSFIISPHSVTGGFNAIGVVVLTTKAPEGGLIVVTKTDSPLKTTVPTSVRVPAGKTTAPFSIITKKLTEISSVTISVKLGDTIQEAKLTIRPPGISAFVLEPDTAAGGDTSSGVITLDALSASPITVTIFCDSAGIKVPKMLVIPAKTGRMSFLIDTSVVTETKIVKITVSASGIAVVATLTVNP